MCEHNAKVAYQFGKFEVYKNWMILKTLYKDIERYEPASELISNMSPTGNGTANTVAAVTGVIVSAGTTVGIGHGGVSKQVIHKFGQSMSDIFEFIWIENNLKFFLDELTQWNTISQPVTVTNVTDSSSSNGSAQRSGSSSDLNSGNIAMFRDKLILVI